jgi:hypothetical protein
MRRLLLAIIGGLEFETFLDHPQNAALRRALGK